MIKSFRARMLATTVIASSILLASSTAHAQEAAAAVSDPSEVPSSGNPMSDIVVTARRLNNERVQRVPVAVTVVGQEQMKELNLTHGEDLLKAVPAFATNLFVISGNNGTGTYLRGIPGVTAYFADAPSTIGNPGQFLDVGSIQVLKGPQGTLFGGTASAGAFVTQPVRPTNAFEGYLTATLGSFGRRNVEGVVNIPLVDDKLLFRFSGRTAHRNGYVIDIATKQDYFDEDYNLLRGQLTWKVADGLENSTLVQYYHMKEHGQVWMIVDYNPNPVPSNNLLYLIFGSVVDQDVARHLPGGDLGLYKVDSPNPNHGWLDEDLLIVNKTTAELGANTTLENVFSYRRNGNQAQSNLDYDGFGNLPTIILTQDPRQYDHPIPKFSRWSNEMLLEGKLMNNRLSYVLGAFATGPVHSDNYHNFSTTFGFSSVTLTTQSDKSQAVFGNVTLDLSDYVVNGLKVGGGFRHTWQQLKSASYGYTYLPPPTPASQLPQSRAPQFAEAKFSNNSWSTNLQYQFNADTLFYLTVSRGLDAGAVNPSAPFGLQTVRPEVLTQGELGVKTTFDVGGMKIRANIAGYYGKFKDIQAFTSALVQVNPPPAPAQYLGVTQNVASARVEGIDAELTIAPAPNFQIGFAGVYNANKYLSFVVINPDGTPNNLSQTAAFNGAPKFKYSLRGMYILPESLFKPEWGKMTLSVNYQHTSSQFFGGATVTVDRATRVQSAANGYGPATVAAGGGTRVANVHQWPSYHNLDASIAWDQPLGLKNLSARATVTNVTNNTFGGIATGDNAIGGTFFFPAQPRSLLVDLTVKF